MRKLTSENLTSKERCMYTLLKDRDWYSYGVGTMLRYCSIKSEQELHDVAMSLSKKINDKINFFVYNNVEYMGLETRRIDYEHDKKIGTNKVEKLIAKGKYNFLPSLHQNQSKLYVPN
jgi:hypothetical protein